MEGGGGEVGINGDVAGSRAGIVKPVEWTNKWESHAGGGRRVYEVVGWRSVWLRL